jgi:hypothetical protein
MTQREKLQAELIEKLNTKFKYFSSFKGTISSLTWDKINSEIEQLEQSISQLQEGECYPREFVEWCIANCDKSDTKNSLAYWNSKERVWIKSTIKQTFDYWQLKVKS